MKETLVEKFGQLQKENDELKKAADASKEAFAKAEADAKAALEKAHLEIANLKEAVKVSDEAKAALLANVDKLTAENGALKKEVSDLKARMQLIPVADATDGSKVPVASGGAAAEVKPAQKDHFTIAMELHGAERTKYWRAHVKEIREDFQKHHNNK